jgi:hypothetical protein
MVLASYFLFQIAFRITLFTSFPASFSKNNVLFTYSSIYLTVPPLEDMVKYITPPVKHYSKIRTESPSTVVVEASGYT